LGVDAAYQRKGVASKLVEEMLCSMKLNRVNTVYTLVNWRDGDLLKFFNRVGFRRGDMINLEFNIENGKEDINHLNPKNSKKGFKDSYSDESSVIIKRMKKNDLNRIIEIDHQLLGEKRSDFWKRKITLLSKKSALPPLIAEMGNKVIGFILGEANHWNYVIPENIGWIDTLGVDAAYQRKGVASKLVEEMLCSMKAMGVTTVYTLVNWRDYTLLRFFDTMGFWRGDMINLELKIGYKKSKTCLILS
ncbi:MAG: GNAT family N-acetyltransferase, partial [Candidatus Hodarchaeota archaeon]